MSKPSEFVAYYSRWRLLLLLALSVGFVFLGLMLAGAFGEIQGFVSDPRRRRIPEELVPPVGWFAIVFFGACGLFVLKSLFDPKPQLRIAPTGITFARWSSDEIPWAAIKEVSTWHQLGQSSILLCLNDPEAHKGKGLLGAMSNANKAITGGDIGISLTGLDRKFDEAMAAIAHFSGADTSA